MAERYWKVVVKYGHVGRRNEVSVPRFIQTNSEQTILDVYRIAGGMPGVKNRGVYCVEPIDELKYVDGKKREEENLYIQKLINFRRKPGGNDGGWVA